MKPVRSHDGRGTTAVVVDVVCRLSRRAADFSVYLLALHATLFALVLLLPDAAASVGGLAAADPAYARSVREYLGTNRSPAARYFDHLGGVLRLDFGRSTRGGFEVTDMLINSLGATAPLALAVLGGIALAFLLSASLLTVDVSRLGRVRTFVRTLASLPGYLLVPPFVIASGAYAVFTTLTPRCPPDWENSIKWTAAVVAAAGYPMLLMMAAAAPAARELAARDFVRTHRAFGCPPARLRMILMGNLWSMLKASTARIVLIGILSTAFVEWLFAIPGVGRLGLEAFRTSDFPVMFAWSFFTATVVLVVTEVETWAIGKDA